MDEDELDAWKDLLIDCPRLNQIMVDTKTLLESKSSVLDGADCPEVGKYTNESTESTDGYVHTLMNVVINYVHQNIQSQEERPRVNYYTAHTELDPFPYPSLLDPVYPDQNGEIWKAGNFIMERSRNNGISDTDFGILENIVSDNIDVFCPELSSGPAADIKTFKVEIKLDAHPVRVRLRNYSQHKKIFFLNL